VEDGPVRKIIEADMKFRNSTLNIRYMIPKKGREIQLELRVYWNEKDKMLKWDFPFIQKIDRAMAQTMFGSQQLNLDGQEGVQHKWCCAENDDSDLALTIINEGIYGIDIRDQSLRLSLVRSPGYSAHTLEDRIIMRQDRFSPRIDQGERSFKVWINGGSLEDRRTHIEMEAQVRNEAPMTVAVFPPALGKKPEKGLLISNPKVICSSLQLLSEDQLQVRLYNSSSKRESCTMQMAKVGEIDNIELKPFEFKILILKLGS
jgi:alpha-mannosidase